MAQSLQEYYNSLSSIYDPQTALIQKQQAQIPGQIQAQKSALEQARVNAFRDISNTASSKGMTFSGFNPQQQAQYVGEKFLPAMAGLEQAGVESQNSLIQALNKINAERSQTALGYRESALQSEAENAARIQAAEMDRQAKLEAAQIQAAAAYQKNQLDYELGLEKERKDIISKYKAVDNGAGGFTFYNDTGAPITAAQFYNTTQPENAWVSLKSFLKNDENKLPYKYMDYVDTAIDDGRMTEQQGLGFLQEKFPWIFG